MKVVPGPLHRPLQSIGRDRLHQIVDSFDLERCDGELIEGGDEHHRGRGLPRSERARHVYAAEAGHFDVEQQDVGRQGIRHAHRALAVAGRSDQVNVRNLREEQLQPFCSQRFVVSNQEPERLFIHRRGPTAVSSIHDNHHQPLGQTRISQPVRNAPGDAGIHW